MKYVVVFCVILVAGSCSFSDGLGSHASSKAPSGPEIKVTPSFESWPHEFKTRTEDSPYFSTGVANPQENSEWYLAGSFTKVDERVQVPYIVPINKDEEFDGIFLPSDGAPVGSVSTMYVDDSITFAGGQITKDGLERAVVWTEGRDGWELAELETKGTQSVVSGSSSDGTMMFGSSSLERHRSPEVWQRVDGLWESLPVDLDGRDRSDYYINSLERLDDGSIVGVGSYLNGEFLSPLFWTEEAGVLRPNDHTVQGLSQFGSFRDLVTGPDGSTIVVGVASIDGFEKPLVLIREGPGKTWIGGAIDFSFQRRLTSGSGFNNVVRSGSSLFATIDDDYPQELFVSTDGGRLWTGTGLIDSGLAPGGVSDNVFAVSGTEILLGAQHNLLRFDNESWSSLDLPVLSQTSDSPQVSTLTVDGDQLVLGGSTSLPLDDGTSQSGSVTWTSSGDDPWQVEALSDSEIYLSGSATNGSTTVHIATTTAGADGSVALFRPDSNKKQVQVTPDPSAATGSRYIFNDVTLDSENNSIVAGALASVEGQVARFFFATPEGELESAVLDDVKLDGVSIAPVCLATYSAGFFAILTDESRQYQVVTSEDGRRWTGQELDPSLDQISGVSCDAIDGEIVINANSEDDIPLVGTSKDLRSWTFIQVGERNDQINQVFEVDGQRFAVGSKDSDFGNRTGYVWYEKDGEWLALAKGAHPTGLEPDGFAQSTSVWEVVEYQDQLVLFGSDRGRVGLWTISKDDLLYGVS